jgi:hypothetical protein
LKLSIIYWGSRRCREDLRNTMILKNRVGRG